MKSKKQLRKIRRSFRKTGCFVYGLKDPTTGETRYVGQTRCMPRTRMRFHYRAIMQKLGTGRKLSPAQIWIKSLTDAGLEPELTLIDERGVWDVTEAVWMVVGGSGSV